MKQRVFKLLLFSVVIVIMAFMGYKVISGINYKNQVAKNIETLPSFEVQDIKGNLFTEKNLQDLPLAIIYFNSECHYCQNETENIKNHIGKFNDFQLLFISNESQQIIKKFTNTYKISDYDNIHFLRDNNDIIATTFDINQIPYILVYGKNKELKHRFKGQVNVDTLLTYLKK